jgi:hypothetical protein
MSFTELLPTVRALPRADQLHLLRFLVDELAREAGVDLLQAQLSYPVWTPLNATDAAATLLKALNDEET